MNEINEKFLNALKTMIEKSEELDPNYELLGINTALVSNNTEACRICYSLNPKQIKEKEKELEPTINDPKVRRFVAEFNILLQNFRFSLDVIIHDAKCEGLITDEEKFFKFFPFNISDGESDADSVISNFVKTMLCNMVIAFAHQN